MFKTKYRELTKKMSFSKRLDDSQLPGYIKHYIYEDEMILVAYKTTRDYGVFTSEKIVLFDNYSKNKSHKQIYSLPYISISDINLLFGDDMAELSFTTNYGRIIQLNFVNLESEDKVRLRVLYTHLNRIISNQKPREKDLKKLVKDNFADEMKMILKK